MGPITFAVLAVAAIASALTVVVHPNPVKSAMALVATLFVLAIFFVFLGAHMIAALQVIVYAGAIMVLFLFVIMLLNLGDEGAEARHRAGPLFRLAAWGGGGVLAGELAVLFLRTPLGAQPETAVSYGGVDQVATSLFTDFLLPFELTSILLLVALVGAVVLGQRRTA